MAGCYGKGVQVQVYNQNMIDVLGPIFHITCNLGKLALKRRSSCVNCLIVFVQICENNKPEL
jgi:hypothetical protein